MVLGIDILENIFETLYKNEIFNAIRKYILNLYLKILLRGRILNKSYFDKLLVFISSRYP